MLKKSCPFLYSQYTIKIGQTVLDRQFVPSFWRTPDRCLSRGSWISTSTGSQICRIVHLMSGGNYTDLSKITSQLVCVSKIVCEIFKNCRQGYIFCISISPFPPPPPYFVHYIFLERVEDVEPLRGPGADVLDAVREVHFLTLKLLFYFQLEFFKSQSYFVIFRS